MKTDSQNAYVSPQSEVLAVLAETVLCGSAVNGYSVETEEMSYKTLEW